MGGNNEVDPHAATAWGVFRIAAAGTDSHGWKINTGFVDIGCAGISIGFLQALTVLL